MYTLLLPDLTQRYCRYDNKYLLGEDIILHTLAYCVLFSLYISQRRQKKITTNGLLKEHWNCGSRSSIFVIVAFEVNQWVCTPHFFLYIWTTVLQIQLELTNFHPCQWSPPNSLPELSPCCTRNFPNFWVITLGLK